MNLVTNKMNYTNTKYFLNGNEIVINPINPIINLNNVLLSLPSKAINEHSEYVYKIISTITYLTIIMDDNDIFKNAFF